PARSATASSIATGKSFGTRRSSFSAPIAVTSSWTRKALRSSNKEHAMDAARAANLSSREILSKAKPNVADLRSFIEKVRQEAPEDVLTISKEVDPRFEITALVVKLEEERRFPILIFENVKGTKFPVVTNVHASRRRLAAAIGSEPRRAVASYLKRIERPIPPTEVDTGPVKRIILKSDHVDLHALPQIVRHQAHVGP